MRKMNPSGGTEKCYFVSVFRCDKRAKNKLGSENCLLINFNLREQLSLATTALTWSVISGLITMETAQYPIVNIKRQKFALKTFRYVSKSQKAGSSRAYQRTCSLRGRALINNLCEHHCGWRMRRLCDGRSEARVNASWRIKCESQALVTSRVSIMCLLENLCFH